MPLNPRMSGDHFIYHLKCSYVKSQQYDFLILICSYTFPSILDDIFPLSVPINPEANLRAWCVFAPAKSLGNIVVSQVLNTSITG